MRSLDVQTPQTDIVNPNLPELGIAGFSYPDLHNPERLQDLMTVFEASVQEQDPDLLTAFRAYREDHANQYHSAEAESDLLVRMASHVGQFVATLFNVADTRQTQALGIQRDFATIFAFRNEIAAKLNVRFKGQAPALWDGDALDQRFQQLTDCIFPRLDLDHDREFAIARGILEIHRAAGADQDPALMAAPLRKKLAAAEGTDTIVALYSIEDDAAFLAAIEEVLLQWCHAAMSGIEPMHAATRSWSCIKMPAKTDVHNLVRHDIVDLGGYTAWSAHHGHNKRRDGFALTDPRFPERRVLYEVDHCIYCHDRDADSCSKGMRNRKEPGFKANALGVTAAGCPLEEKISEMHTLKRQGDNIGALALVTLDNPMCPGTGHRICNDCMKGCIYQKSEPVNIPQIETSVLTGVLFMPWGFEIYSLLTRWNPLNRKRPVALPYNGLNVLVAGMGPAGYTLAHYLLNEGFSVTGIDALKLEPLPRDLTGDADTPPRPIRDFREIYEALDKRILLGFGGVAEYGITVRWDKNFLKVIYLNLLRRPAFRCYGGVRLGGTLTLEDCWDKGFDHVAIASGAGKPTVIDLKNNLTRGIRKASDFLMALQLSGAAKADSIANLQVRLPAGVIGGGLTAIDTATEVLAYYPVQVEKILHRYETLCREHGEAAVRAGYDAEETIILDEFILHGKAIRAERSRAAAVGEKPHFQPLLTSWGGVTLFYRKGMKDAPAYRQNHEEISEALEEGIWLAEGMSPVEALDDEYGHLRAVRFDQFSEAEGRWHKTTEREVPLRSLFIAAGTSPNTIYETEHPESFVMDRRFYQRHEAQWQNNALILTPCADGEQPKQSSPAPFTSYTRDGHYVSFYGDNHPVYAGNVVKAMASAKHGYPSVVSLFRERMAAMDPQLQASRDASLRALHAQLDTELRATIVDVRRLTPTIVEVVVRAPMAARHFEPGQFYRVQNFESLAPRIQDTVLAAEGLALTGAWVDREQGLISLITLEMGGSSSLCTTWKTGDPLVVMGITGSPTEIPQNQTVLLIGGGLGNAVLFSIGKALKHAGNRVIYFAGYRNREDVFKMEDIEASADVIIWSVDDKPGNTPIEPRRPQDKSFVGNIVQAMLTYAQDMLGEQPLSMSDASHLVVIGSDRMMAAVKEARYTVLAPYLKPEHEAIGSINSPMQCMMKGVCAQCLCKHVDPVTGEESFVYSCNNQDQALDRVDFPHLAERLRQNSVQEKLTALWLAHLFRSTGKSE
ncbi:MAG: hypothetical protein RIQ52_34 [Pseudomonadota bacterium]|jgi:NADPH-dependent glutamate synthase beta subunit-like oxidoreductase/NAD(P)H-flavin reductase